MAQDLASAIVDLSASAEKRRQGRRALRDSVRIVIREILRHARVGDQVGFEVDSPDRGFNVYKIERIDWEVTPAWLSEPKPTRADASSPTLFLYRLDHDAWLEDGQLDSGRVYGGSVLLDVRDSIDFTDGEFVGEKTVTGRNVFRVAAALEG